MLQIAALLDRALRNASIPIVGVSVPNPADRSTWRVEFDRSATDDQRRQAAGIIVNLAIDDDARKLASIADRLGDPMIRTFILWVAQLHNLTADEATAQVLAIYRAQPGADPRR